MIKNVYPARPNTRWPVYISTVQITRFRQTEEKSTGLTGCIIHDFNSQNELIGLSLQFSFPEEKVSESFTRTLEKMKEIRGGDFILLLGVWSSREKTDYGFAINHRNAGFYGPMLRLLFEADEELYQEIYPSFQQIYYGSAI